MPRFPALGIEDAPAGSRPTLTALQDQLRRVPNVYATAATSPAVLNGLIGYTQAVETHSALDQRTREAIALVVSEANSCDYCLAGHTMVAKMVGWSTDELVTVRRGGADRTERIDGKLVALLELAEALVATRGAVDDAVLAAAREAGWSDGEILDAFATVMDTMFTNYLNLFARTEIDFPPAGSVR